MEELRGVPTMLEIEELKTLLEKEVVERKESFEQVEKYLFMNDKQSTYNTGGKQYSNKMKNVNRYGSKT